MKNNKIIALTILLFVITGGVFVAFGTLKVATNDEHLGMSGLEVVDYTPMGDDNETDTNTTDTTPTEPAPSGSGSARIIFGAIVGDNTYTIRPTQVFSGSVAFGDSYIIDDIKLFPRLSTIINNVEPDTLEAEVRFKSFKIGMGVSSLHVYTKDISRVFGSVPVAMAGPTVSEWQIPKAITIRNLLGLDTHSDLDEALTDYINEVWGTYFGEGSSITTYYVDIYCSVEVRITATGTDGSGVEFKLDSPTYRLRLVVNLIDETSATYTGEEPSTGIGGSDPGISLAVASLYGPETEISRGVLYIIIGAATVTFGFVMILFSRRR